MKAAILCPGESLRDFPGRERFDLTITVNRAANFTPSDYTVILDLHTWPWLKSDFVAAIVSSGQTHAQLVRAFPAAAKVKFLEWTKDWLDLPGIAWSSKSLGVALALAYVKGADEIRCYGVSWRGKHDFDGFNDQRQKRTPQRWMGERLMVDAVVRYLNKQKVVVLGLPL